MGVYERHEGRGEHFKEIMKGVYEIKLNIDESESSAIELAKRKFGKGARQIQILKKSLDARKKDDIFWRYSISVSDEEEIKEPPLEKIQMPQKVVVIGGGPAGLFCALRLIDRGFLPIIVERGEPVEERKESVARFMEERKLNVNSNVQFGEGGAGAFSDGKLNTQTKDGLNKEVLKIFHKFGAPQEILYLNKPHVGSDNLYSILKNVRKYIEDNGGEYLFDSLFCGVKKRENSLESVILKNVKSGVLSEIQTNCAVVAIGHSANDTFEMLNKSGVLMEAREFAVGVRIEHLSSQIGFSQYGKDYKKLPAADYKLVSHAHERTVFTFCMCPGGVVIPSASEEGGVVTNGMSLYARDGENSNSALMVQMKSSDFKGDDLFAGMRFRRELEQKAFNFCGKNYSAPVQLYGDFVKNRISDGFKEVKATYGAGTVFAPLHEILPPVASDALKKAIPDMDKKLSGFASSGAVLTGVETRFSSPVRILRGESGESVSLSGLYPCGEGSGYSGGITSSAADGLHTAEKIYEKFKNIQ